MAHSQNELEAYGYYCYGHAVAAIGNAPDTFCRSDRDHQLSPENHVAVAIGVSHKGIQLMKIDDFLKLFVTYFGQSVPVKKTKKTHP